jgi:hypothetical protein
MTATTPSAGAKAPRWAGWAAIGFAVLFVVGTLLLDTPEGDASAAEWQNYLGDSGNRTSLIVHGYAWALAAIALIVFLSASRERLRAAGDWIGSLSYASGLVYATFLILAAGVTSAVALAIEFADYPTDAAGEFARYFEAIAFSTVLVGGMFAAGIFLVTAAISFRRGGDIPGWVAILGYIFGVIVFLLGVFFLPQALIVLWMLIVGIVFLVRGQSTATA